MEDIANRSGVQLEHEELGSGITVLTVDQPQITRGKMAGMSLIIDPRRKVMVQWNWPRLEEYKTIGDVRTLQTEVWKALRNCLTRLPN